MSLPNVMLRPPIPPVYYGTSLWSSSDFGTMRGEYFFRRQSVVAWEIERAMLGVHRWEAMEDRVRSKCEICSSTKSVIHPIKHSIFHRHYSSLVDRASTTLDQWGQYYCTTCAVSRHYAQTSDAYYILVTSSTLNGWRIPAYGGDPFHVETIGIPGATIKELHHAMVGEYRMTSRPLNILVCAGLNDVIRGGSPASVIADMRGFKVTVEGWNPNNTVAFCTLFVPPCLSGRMNTIFDLNDLILDLNGEGRHGSMTAFAPRFQTWGLKRGENSLQELFMSARGPVLGNKDGFNYSAFRESSAERMLHLNDKTRMRMGRAVISYFKAVAGLMDNVGLRNGHIQAQDHQPAPQVLQQAPESSSSTPPQAQQMLEQASQSSVQDQQQPPHPDAPVPPVSDPVYDQHVLYNIHGREATGIVSDLSHESEKRSMDNNPGSEKYMEEEEIDRLLEMEPDEEGENDS